jgi:hypothetical protein
MGAARALGFVGLVALAVPAAAQDSAATKIAHVTYITSASAYVDAGRLDGLQEGSRLDVVRGGSAVAELKVAFLASHKASCDIVSASVALVVGDTARFAPVAAPRDAAVALHPRPAPPVRHTTLPSGLRGRVGIEYLGAGQLDGGVGGFTQPGLTLRLDGHPLGAPALGVAVDIRARRNYTVLSDGTTLTDSRNRVYQAAMTFHPPGLPMRVTAGRQISGNLASVGVFDGVLAEVNTGGWGAGMFGGAQPDPIGLQFSTQILEAGAYVQSHSPPGTRAPWSVTLGASASYDGGQPNREFGFLQASLLSSKLWMFFTQEVDYYEPWRRMTSLSPVSPTNTFALVRYRLTGSMTVEGGVDNRRNVVLYRDVVNPVTSFDDAYRQGAWAGWSLRVGRHLLVGLDGRLSTGGPAGRADAYTMSLIAGPMSRYGIVFRSRTTRYSGTQPTGWLESLALGIAPGGGRLHVELNGGRRQQWDPVTDPPTNAWVTWLGADLDVDLARSWYVVMSANRETGGFDENGQIYGGLSYRF